MEESIVLATTRVTVRSYELDSFGHLNHAVYLSYFEHARFEALDAGGLPASALAARKQAVHVVRVEVDYVTEAMMGQEMEILTAPEAARNSSFSLTQVARDPADPKRVFARARVVLVWIGPDRRPMRLPEDVRAGLGFSE